MHWTRKAMTKLDQWNSSRFKGYAEDRRYNPSIPKPDEMPECECGARLVDRDPGRKLLSFPPQAWCKCLACGKTGLLRVW